jgi:hypothetical protein
MTQRRQKKLNTEIIVQKTESKVLCAYVCVAKRVRQNEAYKHGDRRLVFSRGVLTSVLQIVPAESQSNENADDGKSRREK